MTNFNKDITAKGIVLLSFFIPFTLVTNYTLNHWYVSGAYMLDSGLFSFLASHASFPEMQNPASIGGSFLETHFSPIFWLLTLVKNAKDSIPDPLFFAATQGLWAGIIGSCTFHLSRRLTHFFSLSLATAIFSALNGISLAIIGFPHFEIAIPALLILSLTLLTNDKTNFIFIASSLLLLLITREDAGLHAFGLFFTISFFFFFKKNKCEAKKYLTISIACLTYSILALATQKHFFSSGDNAFTRVYSGAPMYAHITLDFILERLEFYVSNREYIYIPILISIIYSLIKKDWLLLLGTLSTGPWILFSMSAISWQAGVLVSYYSFPVMIALLWPTVSTLLNKSYSLNHLYLQMAVCAASILLLPGNEGLHDKNPIKKMGFLYTSHFSKTETAIKDIKESIDRFGNIAVDDSIASFLPNTINKRQWHFGGKYSDHELKDIDTIIFFKDSWLSGVFEDIRVTQNLNNLYSYPGTKIVVASKKDLTRKTHPSNLSEVNTPIE